MHIMLSHEKLTVLLDSKENNVIDSICDQ